jgi:large subunit ribosomal protein L13
MPSTSSTTFQTTKRHRAEWFVIDASQEVLGRMAARVAQILQGKHKPTWTAHADTGDFVVVINAAKVQVTGRKADDKFYRYYTGNHGGLRTVHFPRMLDRHPTDIVKLAVKRMLPKTSLGRHMLMKLKVFPGAEHTHQAQRPTVLELKTGKTAAGSKK